MLPLTTSNAVKYFADPEVVLQFFIRLRWPDEIECPICNSRKVSFLSTRTIWKCCTCKQQFSLKMGTILEKSHISLGNWLIAIWLLANSYTTRSTALHRRLGITQTSAWKLQHQIKLAIQTATYRKLVLRDQDEIAEANCTPYESFRMFAQRLVQIPYAE